MRNIELILERNVVLDLMYTEGIIYEILKGKLIKICDTLEDIVRDYNKDGDLFDINETKVYGETAIGFKRYKLKVSFSGTFNRDMVEVCDVNGFTGIRLHWGRTEKNSLGCILVGKKYNNGELENTGMTDYFVELVRNNNVYLTVI